MDLETRHRALQLTTKVLVFSLKQENPRELRLGYKLVHMLNTHSSDNDSQSW